MAQAQVVTGMVFPSAGVRILIPLVVATFMEEASGEAMYHLSDYNIGMSVGGVLSTAFAMTDAAGKPKFTARDVLLDTYATSAVMFAQDPGRVMINNIRRDLPRIAGAMQSPLVRTIVGQMAKHMPDLASSRYDHALLGRSLERNFGDGLMNQAGKSNLVLAHNMDRGAPAVFGHIDEAAFPGEGLDLSVLPAADADITGGIPLHSDVPITDSLLAATAIPGLIGYRCVDRLKHHFMDAGSLGMPALVNVVEDMHERACNKAEMGRRARPVNVPAAKTLWQRWFTPDTAPAPIVLPEEPVVTRLVMLGIGEEKNIPYDADGGIAAEAGNILRAASDLVTGSSLVSLRKRFNRASQHAVGLPALQIIDAPIGAANGPSMDIKDGRADNLARLLAFGRQIAIDHRATITAEIMLRMETLEARGLRSAEQVAAVARKLEAVASEDGAAALCDAFLEKTHDTPHLLAERGFMPAVAADAPRANAGWLPALFGGGVKPAHP